MIDIARIVEQQLLQELLSNAEKQKSKDINKTISGGNTHNPFKHIDTSIRISNNALQQFTYGDMSNALDDDYTEAVQSISNKTYISANSITGGSVYSYNTRRKNRNYYPYTLNCIH